MFAWLRCKLFGHRAEEKDELVAKVVQQNVKLADAVVKLEREPQAIRRSRDEMNKMLDDTLATMKKEYRR